MNVCNEYGMVEMEAAEKMNRGDINDGFFDKHVPTVEDIVEQAKEFVTNWEADESSSNSIRTFETGATRNTDTDKLDYEGFLSPLVLARYAEYMHKNRIQADGSMRSSDNWQKGIPLDAYMKSLWRHFMDVWMEHRNAPNPVAQEEALCGLLFNTMGYLFELQVRREQ